MVAAHQWSSPTPPESFEWLQPWVDRSFAERPCSLARAELAGFLASMDKRMGQ